MVYRERKVTELLATKAMITGLAMASQRETLDPVFDEYKKYADEMLPFLAKDVSPEKDDAKKALHQFVKYKAEIDLKPVYRAQVRGALQKMSNSNRISIMSNKKPGEVEKTSDALKRK